MYFDKERHVFEGFCVPDFVCRYRVGEEERDGVSRKRRKRLGQEEGEKTRQRKTVVDIKTGQKL